MKQKYIAIDLGAESGRLMLGTLENNKISLKEYHRFPTKGTYMFDSFRWNVLRFWEEIKTGLLKIGAAEGLEFAGIAVDSWGVNFVYLTEDLELACYPFHYRDDLQIEGDKAMRENNDMNEIFRITGLQEISINGLPHLWGVKTKYPQILERTKKICMIPDYFNFLLTGRLVGEYTNASTTQVLNAVSKTWDPKIYTKLGLTNSHFPELLMPGTKIGTLHKQVQEETNLKEVPVWAIGSHDTASAIAAVPAEGENWAYLSSGTWSLFGVEIDKPIINETMKKYNCTNEGGVFGTIRLLKNIIGLWLIQRCKFQWEKELGDIPELSYENLTKEAEKEEPNRTIIDVDDPAFMNPKNMVEAIQTYAEKKGLKVPKTRAQISRCIFDSLAMKYKKTLNEIEEITGKKIEKLHIIGGGSKNSLLCQLTANVLRIKVIAGPVEATAIGNVMMQAYASGLIKDLKELRKIVKNSFEIVEYSPR